MKKFWLGVIGALLCTGFIGLFATERDYGESDPQKLLVLLRRMVLLLNRMVRLPDVLCKMVQSFACSVVTVMV